MGRTVNARVPGVPSCHDLHVKFVCRRPYHTRAFVILPAHGAITCVCTWPLTGIRLQSTGW